MATINPTQQYDIIHTLTFAEASGDCPIRLHQGSSSATSGTVYYRAGTSGNWTSLIDDGNTGDTGYADGVQYTYFFEATRTEEGHLQLVSRMSGGDLGNDGTLEVVFVDETPNTFTFDTFALRPSRADQTADVFSTHLFKVEFIPEPSSFALAGLGLLGVLFARRLRR